jgi:hypothetical protein
MAIGDELSSLDFSALIGGPLTAVVKAQALAAQTSVDFIKSVGFHEVGGIEVPTMVAFSYKKLAPEKNSDGSPKVDGSGNPVLSEQSFTLSVPFLTMLSLPFIEIAEATVDFNAKINSVEERATSSALNVNVSASAKANWKVVSAELKASVSYQSSSSSGSKTERTYSMAVHVRAVQGAMPAGTEKLLGILENSIKEAPTPAAGS